MSSDENTMLEPEFIYNDDGKGIRLFAYSCAVSGKEGSALSTKEAKARNGSGITGLMKELEKTILES